MTNLDQKQSLFLILAALGLTPIALGYGAAPQVVLPWMFGIDASAVNVRHIFRAVMGLYLALAAFWVFGARSPELRIPALWSLTIFMGGLALGRALSLVVDGMPHPLLVVYMFLEIGFCFVGWKLLNAR